MKTLFSFSFLIFSLSMAYAQERELQIGSNKFLFAFTDEKVDTSKLHWYRQVDLEPFLQYSKSKGDYFSTIGIGFFPQRYHAVVTSIGALDSVMRATISRKYQYFFSYAKGYNYQISKKLKLLPSLKVQSLIFSRELFISDVEIYTKSNSSLYRSIYNETLHPSKLRLDFLLSQGIMYSILKEKISIGGQVNLGYSAATHIGPKTYRYADHHVADNFKSEGITVLDHNKHMSFSSTLFSTFMISYRLGKR